MQISLAKSFSGLTLRNSNESQETEYIHNTSSMLSRHNCPCCSYILLRHLALRGLYWHCNHCYQEMPAF